MPPLNHTTELHRDGAVYAVNVIEKDDKYTDGYYRRDVHLCKTVTAAIEAAVAEHDRPPILTRGSSTGMIILDEPHDGDEPYLRVSIREKPVYTD